MNQKSLKIIKRLSLMSKNMSKRSVNSTCHAFAHQPLIPSELDNLKNIK